MTRATRPRARSSRASDALRASCTLTCGCRSPSVTCACERYVCSRIGMPSGCVEMVISRGKSNRCVIGHKKGSFSSEARMTQVGRTSDGESERSQRHSNAGRMSVRPSVRATARASRSARRWRRASSRCAASRGEILASRAYALHERHRTPLRGVGKTVPLGDSTSALEATHRITSGGSHPALYLSFFAMGSPIGGGRAPSNVGGVKVRKRCCLGACGR
eukprot:4788392-Prymnesium_polylepis.2